MVCIHTLQLGDRAHRVSFSLWVSPPSPFSLQFFFFFLGTGPFFLSFPIVYVIWHFSLSSPFPPQKKCVVESSSLVSSVFNFFFFFWQNRISLCSSIRRNVMEEGEVFLTHQLNYFYKEKLLSIYYGFIPVRKAGQMFVPCHYSQIFRIMYWFRITLQWWLIFFQRHG